LAGTTINLTINLNLHHLNRLPRANNDGMESTSTKHRSEYSE
jgi:hypothetical protein